MIKAVIFDMDGLMIDSEPFQLKAFNKVFEEYGKELPEDINNKDYVGKSDADTAPEMVARFQLPITPEELVKKKQEHYLESLTANNIAPMPGLIDLLDKLKANKYKIAIGSSASIKEIHAVVETLHIQNFIDTFASADEVKQGKPSPEIFLLAAKRLNMQPEECLVLEDGVSGLQAAIACGMKCYVIPSRQTEGRDFHGAYRVLESLSNVFPHLQADSKFEDLVKKFMDEHDDVLRELAEK